MNANGSRRMCKLMVSESVRVSFTQSGGGRVGFTLIEFMIVVVLLAVLAAFFLPALMKPRMRASRLNCTNHLKQVGLAFRMWALDNGDSFPMQVSLTNGDTMELPQLGRVYPHFIVMSNELNTPKILLCPEDKSRRFASSFTTNFGDSNISYFVGLDANATMPQMFLAGDRNLVGGTLLPNRIRSLTTNDAVSWGKDLHNQQGNVAMADGSVQQFNSVRLGAALMNTGTVTNRLAIP